MVFPSVFTTSALWHPYPTGGMITTHASIFSTSNPGLRIFNLSLPFRPPLCVQDTILSLRPSSYLLYKAFPDRLVRIYSFRTQFYISIITHFKFSFYLICFFASYIGFLIPLTNFQRAEPCGVGPCSPCGKAYNRYSVHIFKKCI